MKKDYTSKFEAVRSIRDALGCSLLEAKEHAESQYSKDLIWWPTNQTSPSLDPKPSGNDYIDVIKAVHQHYPIGLKKAKEMVDRAIQRKVDSALFDERYLNPRDASTSENAENASNADDAEPTMFDFEDGKGLVPAHRHQNPDGTVGGWVANTAFVDDTAFVGYNAKVYGNAEVSGDARVTGNARVSGNAKVSGDARIYGNALVTGNARVSGKARVFGYAKVYGNARVSGEAKVDGKAHLFGYAKVDWKAQVFGKAQVFENAQVSGKAKVYGNARVYGSAKVFENAKVHEDARVSGYAKVYGNAEVCGYTQISGYAWVYEDGPCNDSRNVPTELDTLPWDRIFVMTAYGLSLFENRENAITHLEDLNAAGVGVLKYNIPGC